MGLRSVCSRAGWAPSAGIAQRQHGDGDKARHLREGRRQLLRVEHPHVGGAKTQIRRLQHHLGHGDGGVDLAVVFPVILPVPCLRRVIGHRQQHRRMEVAAHAGVRLRHGLRALQHEDALGLVVMGGGGVASCLQHLLQQGILHRPVTELTQGVPLRRQLRKIHIHSCLSSDSVPIIPCPAGGCQKNFLPGLDKCVPDAYNTPQQVHSTNL